MALTKDRNTPRRDGVDFEYPMAAATVGYAGGIAVLNAGLLGPGTTATGRVAVGVFVERANNSAGAAGAIRGKVRRGVFRFKNSSAADEITLADVGNNCWIVDDEQVAKTNGSGTRSVAGRIEDVDANGVWVRF
jgi:hypothetical protein